MARKQERMQNYQLWVPAVQWQVPELWKQNAKTTSYTVVWHPKEGNTVP